MATAHSAVSIATRLTVTIATRHWRAVAMAADGANETATVKETQCLTLTGSQWRRLAAGVLIIHILGPGAPGPSVALKTN